MNVKEFLKFYDAPSGDSAPAGGGVSEVVSSQPTQAADAADVFSSGADDSGPGEVVADVTPAAPAVVTPAPVTPPPAPAVVPQQQQLTPERIADIAAQAAIRVGQQQTPQVQPAPQPQMSQEEFNKTFNVVNLNANDFAAITGYVPDKPEQVAALNNFAQGIVKQALTMAQVHIASVTQSLEQRFGQQISPLTQQREAQVGEAVKNEFFTAHQDLKDLEPLVTEIANQAKTSGQKFASKEEAFKFVADRVRSLVPRAPTAASQPGATAPNQPQGQQPVQRRMATTSVGSQASSSGGSATGSKSDAKSIFG